MLIRIFYSKSMINTIYDYGKGMFFFWKSLNFDMIKTGDKNVYKGTDLTV